MYAITFKLGMTRIMDALYAHARFDDLDAKSQWVGNGKISATKQAIRIKLATTLGHTFIWLVHVLLFMSVFAFFTKAHVRYRNVLFFYNTLISSLERNTHPTDRYLIFNTQSTAEIYPR